MRDSVLARVRGLLTAPRSELPKTIAEAGDFKSLLPYVLVLLSIGTLARFVAEGIIGRYVPPQVVFGMKIGGGWFRAPLAALVGALFHLALGVAVWWFFATMLNKLGPKFGARQDQSGAFKVAAWVATPIWLAGAFALFMSVPYVGWLNAVGHVVALAYAVLIGVWALPLLMGTPDAKAPGHILAVLGITIAAAVIVGYVLFGVVLDALFPSGAALLH